MNHIIPGTVWFFSFKQHFEKLSVNLIAESIYIKKECGFKKHTECSTYTNVYPYIYIYIYICVYACVCVCVSVSVSVSVSVDKIIILSQDKII